MVQLSAPLEVLLQQYSESRPQDFPNRQGGYFAIYETLKRTLDQKYYSVAGTGLARGGSRYTKHDIGHVDDVIHTVGRMLGCGSGAVTPAYEQLQPFELFVLLTAILLHDAGNAIGREGHEGAAASILNEIAAGTTLGSVEKRLIASIARAHGGKLSNGDKDTIPALITEPLSTIHGARVHGRRLAALLRLGDELSEGPTRADSVAIKGGPDVPAESVLANKFCRDININIDYIGHSFELSFEIDVLELSEKYSIKTIRGAEDVYFVDFIRDRLEKCETERRYCNRYLSGFASYDRMRVKLFIIQQDEQIGQLSLVLEESGYPQLKPSVRAEEQDFDGYMLCQKYCQTEAAQ